VLGVFDATTGFDGQPRKDSAMVCTNPITGIANGTAEAKDNLGTLVPTKALDDAQLSVPGVPAACTGRGFLSIGAPIDLGGYVLPGNNYHVFDYSLFWANTRMDAMRRLKAFSAPAPAKL
jgi:hypothetical protein